MQDLELQKQLIAIFKTELDEKLQIITDGLFALEKDNKKKINTNKIIEEIFRAAHNIKGAARSIGISAVGEIAHQIESIFAAIRANNIKISADLINLCLQAVDGMHTAMQCHCENKPLNFDLDDLLCRLQIDKKASLNITDSRTSRSDRRRTALDVNETMQDVKKYNEISEYETVRVPLHQIDHVSALLEQMQTTKIAIDDHYSQVFNLAAKIKQLTRQNAVSIEQIHEINQLVSHLTRSMHADINDLNLLTNSLQEEVRMLRLVPASTLLQHFTRSVRDLAHELDKKIEFEIHGDTVKMDKMILEGLKDPMLHLLRNAVDHGIESSQIRKQNGKSEMGKIKIEVIDEGNQILININDDGAGIDYKKIASCAKKKGIILQSELDNMNENSILELIFRPEFSTKEIITEISGRGVGLDVVKSNVADLKGQVTFSTDKGKGTSFNLRVPLTLSSDIGLMIKSGGQLFIIPISSIERVVILDISEIHNVEATQIILFDGVPILLSTLADILNLQNEKPLIAHQLPVIVLKKCRDTIALLVEEIIGEREIVIKSLQPPLVNVPCVTGGTLSGTGEVIIVLNPKDIVKRAINSSHSKGINLQAITTAAAAKNHILLVDDSITTRTLEKNILENSDYKVSTAVDGVEAWDLLQKEHFSLVITDIEMPNMDGFDLTERIKKSDKLQNLPVIIVTSLGSEEQKKRGIEVGANAYIVKHDFESLELLEIVGQLV